MTAPNMPPTAELGRPGNMRPTINLTGPATWTSASPDPNLDLRFPRSVATYDRMRIDEQVAGVIAACTLPILEAGWDLNCDGVAPQVEELIRAEIGIPRPGEPLARRRRGQAGIVWREHLREALGALTYGFMPFEQVYSVTMPGEATHPAGFDRPVVHLRKLAQRLPGTIRRINVADDGGLASITQAGRSIIWNVAAQDTAYTAAGFDDIVIPVERLVFYTVDREGADWSGRSMLRAAYGPWFVKDRLIRVDAQTAERQGMGIPVVHYDQGSSVSKEEALEIATSARAGATAGIALPAGVSFELVGLTGSTVDVTSKIEYHDRRISRSGLAMFMDLGTTKTGSRALGSTLLDFFTQAMQAHAAMFAQVATEHIVRDLVEWNFGPDEPYPSIVAMDMDKESALGPDQYKLLVEAGVLTPDPGVEEQVRDRWGLPPASPPDPNVPELPAAVPPPAGPATPAATPVQAPPGPNLTGDTRGQIVAVQPGKVQVKAHTRNPSPPRKTLSDLGQYAQALADRAARLTGRR